MDEVQLLKAGLKKEVLQMKKKIDKVQDSKKKQQLLRGYNELINAFDL